MKLDVLESLSIFTAPMGPYGDFHRRQQDEEAWLLRMSVEEALELVAYAGKPSELPNCPGPDQESRIAIADEAATYAGIVGNRTRDERIRLALEDLLLNSDACYSALLGLEKIASQTSIAAIEKIAGNLPSEETIALTFTLEAIGGIRALHVLQRLKQQWKTDRQVSTWIQGVIDGWK